MVQFIIAGGPKALGGGAVEADEDSRELGRKEIAKKKPTRKRCCRRHRPPADATPFTIAAIKYARAHGVKNRCRRLQPEVPACKAAHLAIVRGRGRRGCCRIYPHESRHRAEMILNMLSTGAMTRLGYVYGNLMVNLHTKNEKFGGAGRWAILEEGRRTQPRSRA